MKDRKKQTQWRLRAFAVWVQKPLPATTLGPNTFRRVVWGERRAKEEMLITGTLAAHLKLLLTRSPSPPCVFTPCPQVSSHTPRVLHIEY